MNDITNTTTQTPIEIALGVDENGMTTAKKLYTFLELAPQNYARWCKSNITDNEFAEENVDYWAFFLDEERNFNPNPTQDFKLTAHFAKKLSCKGNGERAEQAREYFTRFEEKAKEVAINRSQLSESTQALFGLIENMARQELEQKRQAAEIAEVKQTVQNIKKELTEPIGDWRSEINSKVREISIKSGIEYQELFSQMYGELEQTAHCSLKRLCENKRDRMEKAGNTKTCIKNETTKIAIIEGKPQLKAIFEGIVRRYAMSYCA